MNVIGVIEAVKTSVQVLLADIGRELYDSDAASCRFEFLLQSALISEVIFPCTYAQYTESRDNALFAEFFYLRCK